MIANFALALLWGIPIIAYSSLDFLLAVILTAFVGYRINKGKCRLPNPILWHKILAGITILLGLVNAVLGLAIIFGF
jgi:hypothetical protein